MCGGGGLSVMKAAYGPIASAHSFDPPAPLRRAGVSRAQRRALMLIFFAGEMNRSRQYYIAAGSEPVLGTVINALHARGMVRLCVERRKRANFGKIIEYRYFVKLTDRGEWYATTAIQQKQELIAALSPPVLPDDYEASDNVYQPDEVESEAAE